MDLNENDLMPWVDIETFGLNIHTDPIIEVGIKVTDSRLETVCENSWLIWSPFHDKALERLHIESSHGDSGAQYVLDMHTKNNLFVDAKEDGLLRSTVSMQIADWLEENNVTQLPMCGSSVQFDRNFIDNQLPVVGKKFHYRNIDVSTLKELCRRYRPDLFAVRPDDESPHRALPDLVHSVAEFKFYRQEFLNA